MNWSNLRKKIHDHFSLGELKTLCFDIEIDYESLSGENKEEKIRELLAFIKRTNRTDELLNYCRTKQPKAKWPKSIKSSTSNDVVRTRQTILKKVRSNWITDVLENSLHLKALESLNPNQAKPAELPLLMSLDLPNKDVVPPSSQLDLIEIFDEEESLVIYGGSGSGKTTTLLNIASKLIDRAEDDNSKPIPIVLSLSSWKKGTPISVWIISELRKMYQIERKIAQDLIESEQLVLLLDDLNSHGNGHREEQCIRQLEWFFKFYSYTQFIICNGDTYRLDIDSRLRRTAKIYLNLLTPSQVEQYLSMGSLKQDKIQNDFTYVDGEIQKLYCLPLNLSLFLLTKINKSLSEKNDSFASNQNVLIKEYVLQMINDLPDYLRRAYEPHETFEALRWMAKRTESLSGNPIYWPNNIKTDLLSVKARRIYHRINRAVNGSLLGLLFWISLAVWGFSSGEQAILEILLWAFPVIVLIIGPTFNLIWGGIGSQILPWIMEYGSDYFFSRLPIDEIVRAQIRYGLIYGGGVITGRLYRFLLELDITPYRIKLATYFWVLQKYLGAPQHINSKLSFASKLNLVRVVCNGYMFVHRDILDYFSQMEKLEE